MVGDGQYRILGATHDRDRILFFTEGNTWITKNEDATLESFATCGMYSIGCASYEGVIKTDNDPITVGPNTIYRWESTADGSLRAISISKNVDSYWDKDLYSRAQLCFDPSSNELWVNDPKEGTVWICRLDSGDWFRYTNLPAERLIWMGDRMGFRDRSAIYQFKEDLDADIDRDQVAHPICAVYEASFGDLGSPDIKTVTRMTLHGFTHNSPVSVSLFGGDLPETVSIPFTTGDLEGLSVLQRRCRSGRFSCANLKITSEGIAPALIRRVTVHTH